MDSTQYSNILKDVLAPNIQDGFLLQQDNAPCHRSNQRKEVMKDLGIPLLPDWLARSPDLNIIEHIWKILKDAPEGLEFDHMDVMGKGSMPFQIKNMLIYIKQSSIKLKLL